MQCSTMQPENVCVDFRRRPLVSQQGVLEKLILLAGLRDKDAGGRHTDRKCSDPRLVWSDQL
jgi:hypothetical protein